MCGRSIRKRDRSFCFIKIYFFHNINRSKSSPAIILSLIPLELILKFRGVQTETKSLLFTAMEFLKARNCG